MTKLSWEESVRWYRSQPDNEVEVRNNYFSLPVLQAAERYRLSEEFVEVLRLLGQGNGRSILDLGAGNGIASFALAQSGWQVTALEPDDSEEVGAGAIRQIVAETGLQIAVVQEWGENLPFPDACFAAVHARQVLHHAADIEVMLQEIARVLQPGGMLLATREHVVDDEKQLAAFLQQHPLHALYGGENAFPLSRYQKAISSAGLQLKSVWGPLDSILNFYPGTEHERQQFLNSRVNRRWRGLGKLLSWSRRFRNRQIQRARENDSEPGRLFSFLAVKSD